VTYICEAQHVTLCVNVSVGLRCWIREGHEGAHMSVLKNVDREVCTHPVVVRW
jgi:hypothetical protein